MSIMRDFGCKTRYYVVLFGSLKSDEVILTSEYFYNLHDCREFVNWLSHQILGQIPYQIVECTVIDGVETENPFPRTAMKSHAYNVTHVPPSPLYMSVKKMRRKDRESQGFFYSYSC